jgi:hypothetical protein
MLKSELEPKFTDVNSVLFGKFYLTCDIWGFDGDKDTSRGLLRSDAV